MNNLSNLQLSILIGLLLSVGTLVKRNKGPKAGAYFSLTQTSNKGNIYVKAHIELVKYVFNLFKDFTNFTEPHMNLIKKGNKSFEYIYFNTVINPLFTELHKIWYIDGVKHVPNNISDLLNPVALAFSAFT